MPHLSAVTADDTCHIAVELIGNNKPATTLHEQGASDVSFGLLNQRDAQPSPDVAGSVAAIAERHWLGGPRDREMLNTAETGHLALASINTLDAEKIVERILGMFTRAEHASVPPEAIPCPSR